MEGESIYIFWSGRIDKGWNVKAREGDEKSTVRPATVGGVTQTCVCVCVCLGDRGLSNTTVLFSSYSQSILINKRPIAVLENEFQISHALIDHAICYVLYNSEN